jgi:hypothetical protein
MQRLYIIYLVQFHRKLVSTVNSQHKWFLTIDCLPNSAPAKRRATANSTG